MSIAKKNLKNSKIYNGSPLSKERCYDFRLRQIRRRMGLQIGNFLHAHLSNRLKTFSLLYCDIIECEIPIDHRNQCKI